MNDFNRVLSICRTTFVPASETMLHIPGYFYMTLIFLGGPKLMIIEETPKAGQEIFLTGQQLLRTKEEIETGTNNSDNQDSVEGLS
jgi:hypothetical protein